jgi:hypothetical protein
VARDADNELENKLEYIFSYNWRRNKDNNEWSNRKAI